MGKSSKKLYFFTASFPYGLGETWKSNELKYFIEYFSEITVVPYGFGGNFDKPKLLPPGVKCEQPLFRTEGITAGKSAIFRLLDRHLFYYLEEFLRKKVFLSKKKLASWLHASLQVQRLLKHPVINEIMEHPSKDTVLYFFWGKGSCDFLPFTDKKKFSKILVRFHRYDLFEDQNDGYIPYRRQLLNSMSIAAPSSNNGLNHLRSLYPQVITPLQVIRMGVTDEGQVPMSDDKILRIISCSYVSPVKRVHLIAQALQQLSIPVQWTHVGDGPLMKDLRQIIDALPPNIEVKLPGMIDTLQLINFYKEQEVDIFINVSSSEGVPMSIMECLSLSIPVFATDVGGTAEIVDDTVGKILKADFKPAELAQYIYAYYNLSTEQKRLTRQAARNRYQERCDVEVITRQLAELLIQ